MSEGTNIDLAHRDLGIEIEKLIEDRDYWKKIAETMADLNAFCYKTTREQEIQSAIDIIESNKISIEVLE